MALPFNPMSFVTPYSAVSTANAGKAFGDARAQATASKVSEGYLANTQHQTAENDKRYGQQEVDKARAQLDAAMELGNSDVVESALNNLRTIGARYGISINETRSDARLTSDVKTDVGSQKTAPVGSEENPFDADAYDAEQAKGKSPVGSEAKPFNVDAYDAERGKASPFTGGVPGGSLPAKAAVAATAPEMARPPGGSLPVAEAPPADEPSKLQGYSINGPDGKPVYSVAPKDVVVRQRQRVTNVFDGLASKTNDEDEKALIAQGQAMAERLVGVESIDKAVEKGLMLYTQGMQRMNALKITDLNHKGRFLGGGGGTGGMLGKGSDAAESVQIYDDNATTQSGKIQEEDRQYATIQDAINSGDPSMQRDAVNQLLKIRSGSAVTASEDARIQRIDGLMPQLASMFGQWTGGDMSPEMVSTIRQIVTMKRSANAAKIERIYKHQADLYKVQNKRKVKDPGVVDERAKVLEEGGKPAGATPDKSHLWE